MVQKRMPVLFIGHGSPENALKGNKYTQEWSRVSKLFPKPRAIVCVSAHWLTENSKMTADDKPETIHDFYGFPQEMYSIKYPAPGSPAIAKEVRKALNGIDVELDYARGLDHGTWVVLKTMYPKADIPTMQLSINYGESLQRNFDVGKKLAELRDKGILVIGSGNVVHNLRAVSLEAKPYAWAKKFDKFVVNGLEKKEYDSLIHYEHESKDALFAHPTNDHYRPLMHAMAAAEDEKPEFFNKGDIFAGSVSMTCAAWGLKK